jgi:hypothetical protein
MVIAGGGMKNEIGHTVINEIISIKENNLTEVCK